MALLVGIDVHGPKSPEGFGQGWIELDRCPVFFNGAVRIALLVEYFRQFEMSGGGIDLECGFRSEDFPLPPESGFDTFVRDRCMGGAGL